MKRKGPLPLHISCVSMGRFTGLWDPTVGSFSDLMASMAFNRDHACWLPVTLTTELLDMGSTANQRPTPARGGSNSDLTRAMLKIHLPPS